jgi:LacI family transcriptional regulator
MSIVKIANHAGVSTATVSRVLNNFPHVGAETARQVRASAEALNYTLPASKRVRRRIISRLRQSQRGTRSITILTIGQTRQWLQLPVMAAAVAGITRGAREHDLRLMLDEQLDRARPSAVITNHGVDGAIVFVPSSMTGTAPREALASLKKHLPVVWVMGAGAAASGVDHISADHQAIGFMALEYLKERNCRSVAFLTMNPQWHLMRTRGYAFAAAAHESRIEASFYLQSDELALANLYGPRAVVENDLESLIVRMVQSQPRPTGLFISNDATTVQAYPLLEKMGIQIGRDMTVVSCDNEEIRLSGLNPRPASIDVGAEEIGWRAVRQLVTRLEHADDPPVLISVAPKMVAPQGSDGLGLAANRLKN